MRHRYRLPVRLGSCRRRWFYDMVPQLLRSMHHCTWETIDFTFLGTCISIVLQTHSITQRQPFAPIEPCIINPRTRGDYLQTQRTRALLFQPAKNAVFAERVPAGFHGCSKTPWNSLQACAERCRRCVSHVTSTRPGMRTSSPIVATHIWSKARPPVRESRLPSDQ